MIVVVGQLIGAVSSGVIFLYIFMYSFRSQYVHSTVFFVIPVFVSCIVYSRIFYFIFTVTIRFCACQCSLVRASVGWVGSCPGPALWSVTVTG